MSERKRLVNTISKAPLDNTTIGGKYYLSTIWGIVDYLLENGVVVLPRKLNLPDELYRYMFDDDRQAVPIKCKVVKITGYGFTLKHPIDGREWEYKYNRIGNTVFFTKEETVDRIKVLKGGAEQ